MNDQQLAIMDRWFNSTQWQDVKNDADKDDTDSIELLETINGHLESIIFHTHNGSPGDRIDYEVSYFAELCDDFEVA